MGVGSGRVRGAALGLRVARNALPTRRKASWPTSIFALEVRRGSPTSTLPPQVSIPSPLPGYGSHALTAGLQMLGSTVNPREQRFFGNGDLRVGGAVGRGQENLRRTVGRWTRTTVSMFKDRLAKDQGRRTKTRSFRPRVSDPAELTDRRSPNRRQPVCSEVSSHRIWPASQTPPTGMTVDRPTPTNFLDAPRTTYFVRIITRIKPISPQSSGCHGTIPDR